MFPKKLRLGSTLELRAVGTSPYHQVPRRFIGKLGVWPVVHEPGPLRDEYPQFNLSPLILDLASEDAKNVRDYDPELDGIPEMDGARAKQKRKPLETRIRQFQRECNSDQAIFYRISQERCYERRINDCDILSAVMRRKPLNEPPASFSPDLQPTREDMSGMTKNEMAEYIWLWNGIPRFTWHTASDAVPYMLRRREQWLRIDREQAGPSEQAKIEGRQKGRDILPLTTAHLIPPIEACVDLVSLKRFVQNLLWTPGGTILASQLSSIIARACERVHSPVDSHSALNSSKFLGDVFLNLSARGLPVAAEFRGIGFLMAVRCYSLSAARQYLTTDLEYTDPTDVHCYTSHLTQGLRILSAKVRMGCSGELKLPAGLNIQQYLVEVFSLLSGYELNGHFSSKSIQKVMWSVNFAHCERLLSRYLRILGELGALRTLWHACQALDDYQLVVSNSTAKDTSKCFDPAAQQGMFYRAFKRTLSNVLGNRLPLEALSGEGSTGIFPDDCRMDLRTIIQPTRVTDEVCLGSEPPAQEATAVDEPSANQSASAATSPLQKNADSPESLIRTNVQRLRKALVVLGKNKRDQRADVLNVFSMPEINDSMATLYDMLGQASRAANSVEQRQ